MAVQVYCEACKTSNDVAAKRCKKCGVVFGRDRTFRVDVTVKGRRVTRQAPNLTVARELEASLKTEMLREEFDISVHKTKKVVTLGDVWERYISWAKVNKAKSWMTDEFFYRKHLQPRFGSKSLEDISSLDIERMKAEMKKETTPQGKVGYADATIRHQLVLLGHLFNKAREWSLFEGKNPMESVKKPKLDNKITEFLMDDEVARLLETLDSWPCKQSADFVRIGLYTAMRKGEILKLKWESVDVELKMVIIRDPKGKLSQTIPISDEGIAVFRGIERTSDYVIPGPDGAMKKTFRDPWYKIRKAAGLPENFRYHGLRHNLASHLVSNGMDLYTVSKLLTHKDVRTTERYAHLSDERLRQAATMSGKLLTPKREPDNIIPMPADRV